MGKRSLTVLKERNTAGEEKEIVVIYKQWNCQLIGHGRGLAEMLTGYKVTKGFNPDDKRKKVASGAGCMAAQIVMAMKEQFPVGEIYLKPAGTRNCGEEYIYEVIIETEKPIEMIVTKGGEVLYSGPADRFKKWLKASGRI